MQFHRNGQLDDRRRRVLTEEVIGSGSAVEQAQPRSSTGKSTRYGDGTLVDRQPRITDLMPRGYGVIALVLLAGLALVAGLEALYYWMPQMAAMTTDGRIAAFDLDGEGSLAVWFSSATLALCAVVAMLIYTIRRHRQDDYHGRYRVWLWAAACWMLMSIDEGASLHEGFKEMMAHLTGQRFLGDGSVWWIGAYGLLLGIVGLRLLLEMRECRTSTTALVATAGCYATAVVAQIGWVLPESGAVGVMLEEGCEMAGNVLLLVAMLTHARYVILEAEGAVTPRRRRKKAAEKSTDTKTAAAKPTAAKEEAATVATEKRGWFGLKRKQPAEAAGTKEETAKKSAAAEEKPARTRPSRSTQQVEEALDEYSYDEEEDDTPSSRKRRSLRRFDDEEDAPRGTRRSSKAERKAARRQKRSQDDF